MSMTIQELKNQIESGVVTDAPLIFKDDDSRFLSTKFITAISKVKKFQI